MAGGRAKADLRRVAVFVDTTVGCSWYLRVAVKLMKLRWVFGETCFGACFVGLKGVGACGIRLLCFYIFTPPTVTTALYGRLGSLGACIDITIQFCTGEQD